MKAQRPDGIAPTERLQAWGKVVAEMADIRAVTGVPLFKPPVSECPQFLMMKSPLDKQDGNVRFRNLAEGLQQRQCACAILAPLFEQPSQVDLREVRGALR